MNDWFSLLTRLPWRFDFNSLGLKSIGLISSSADVRRSRAEFDQIRWFITMNPASIGSQSSLNAGESWWTQDIPSKSLNCLTIRSKVKRRRDNTSVFKEEFPRETWVVWYGESQSMATITRWSWATIVRRSWATISRSLVFRRLIVIIASRWVLMHPRVSPWCATIAI